MPRKPKPALYSPAGIADALGVHRKTVTTAIQAERLPAVPILGPGDRVTSYAVSMEDARALWGAEV